MATDSRTLPAFLGTDAEFRTWGGGLAAQFAAMGLVQVTGAGELDWTTAVRPAINTYNSKAGGTNGYEIWRFADSLQATVPVFIKIEYGIAAVADRPSIAYTVGTTHNGSGTLGGQIGTRKTLLVQVSKTTGIVLPSYCSGSTSRLSLVTNMDSANSSFAVALIVERPKDASGANTAEGIVTYSQAAAVAVQHIPASGAVPAQATQPPFIRCNLSGQNSNLSGNISLSPHFALFGTVRMGSSLAYNSTDIGALASISLTHQGSVHTYMPIGATGPNPDTGTSLAILWE